MTDTPPLDYVHHDRPERHVFGEALGIPNYPKAPGNPGVSPVPAREDHTHGLSGGVLVFSSSDPVIVGVSKAIGWFPVDAKIYKVAVRLGVEGTSSTVINILKDGTNVKAITLISGQGADATLLEFAVSPEVIVTKNSKLQVQIVTAGTAAEAPTIYIYGH